MLQKCAILGLVLLLAGGFAYGWLYQEMRNGQQQAPDPQLRFSLGPEEYVAKYGRWYALTTEQQNLLVLELDRDRRSRTKGEVAGEQEARLQADLDKLATGRMRPGDVGDFLYGQDWQTAVEQYRKHKEQTRTAQTISVVFLSIGGVIFGLCVVIGVLRYIVYALKEWRHAAAQPPEPEPAVPELTDLEFPPSAPAEDPDLGPGDRPKLRRRVLSLSESPVEPGGSSCTTQKSEAADTFFDPTLAGRTPAAGLSFGAPSAAEEAAVAVLLTDEQYGSQEWSAQGQWSAQIAMGALSKETAEPEAAPAPAAAPVPAEPEKTSAMENSLRKQAEDLQRQIAEFRQGTQDAQQSSREHAEPLSSTLKELTQQVSAIREYAACQQGRVEKLQDGYDWGIIRSFGLRVIRCLDNLENRIGGLSAEDEAFRHLEEVRDELLFAMESSGIEQFRPELQSDYCGLEKQAETIREREPAPAPDQAGKIAKVIRPGYRYMIDDENYKVVRTAQVKLFG
jgi:molecular chaperone GrpE (heat shock protein)